MGIEPIFSKSQSDTLPIKLYPPSFIPHLLKNNYFLLKEFKELDGFQGQLWIESNPLEGISPEIIEKWEIPMKKMFNQGNNFIMVLDY